MDGLSSAEREFVALGAALGSNCVPCIEHHVPAARRAGLSDRQIQEAIRLADTIRRVPARKVLDTALGLLSGPACTSKAAGQSVGADEAAPAATRAKHDDGHAAPTSTSSDEPCCR